MRRYPIENAIADFEVLFKVVGRINLLQIQGGEPLTCTALPKLTGCLSACREVGEIVVATNGTITPSDEVTHTFSINGMKFRVSNCPQNKDSTRFDCGASDTPGEDNDAVVAERFNKCAFKVCLTLENGELHRCSRATNAHKLQGSPRTILFASEKTAA